MFSGGRGIGNQFVHTVQRQAVGQGEDGEVLAGGLAVAGRKQLTDFNGGEFGVVLVQKAGGFGPGRGVNPCLQEFSAVIIRPGQEQEWLQARYGGSRKAAPSAR